MCECSSLDNCLLAPRAPCDDDAVCVRPVDVREEVALELRRDVFRDLERHRLR